MRVRIAFWLGIGEFHLRNTSKKIASSFLSFFLHFWNFIILDVCEIDLKYLLHILNKYATIRVVPLPVFSECIVWYPYTNTRPCIPFGFVEEAKRKLEEASSNFTALFLYFCWLQ